MIGAWIDPDDPQEVNAGGYDLTVNVGSCEAVIIDKLYGPLAADLVKVYLDPVEGEWVVEAWDDAEAEWIVQARWDCQQYMGD